MKKISKKPVIVYFHRYSIEDESLQFPILYRILRELAKKYKVIYFSMKGHLPENPRLRKEISIESIPLRVKISNSKDKWAKTLLYYLLFPRTLLRLKKLNPDYIICKETLPFVPFFLGKLRKPMVIDISDWWFSILLGNSKIGRKFAGFIERLEVRKWDKMNAKAMTHSKAEADLLEDKGFSREKINIINAPLPEETYFRMNAKHIRNKLNFNKDSWVVSVHGIIHPSKGYGQLIDWWERLIRQYPNWKLMIIGGAGIEKKYLKEIEKRNLSENIIMTGWLPNQKIVNEYLNASNCLLVNRRNTLENQGVIPSSLYHNLLLEKPTVATGLKGMSEVIENGIDGYLFEPDNYDSFKFILEEIYHNPKKSIRVAKKGVKKAQKCFNNKPLVKKFLDIVSSQLKS